MTTSDPTSWMAFGAITAGIAAGWRHVLSIWRFLRGLILVEVKLELTMPTAMKAYLLQKHNPWKFNGNRHIYDLQRWVRPRKRQQRVPVESYKLMLCWIDGWPLVATIPETKEGSPRVEMLMLFFRGTIDIDKLVVEAMEDYNNHEKAGDSHPQRFYVAVLGGTDIFSREKLNSGSMKQASEPAAPISDTMVQEGNSSWLLGLKVFGFTHEEIMPERNIAACDDLALSPDAQELFTYCEHWYNSCDWFMERRVPWRYGFGVYGEPGCGKTSLVRAIAQKLDLPIFVLDLGSMTNKDLTHHWKVVSTSTPCMVLIEDIDGVFHGRENITKKEEGVTFDRLLNCIDGVGKSDGILLAVTTNDIKKIDPALGLPVEGSTLSTRPGRLDRMVCMGKPDWEGRHKIAQRILGDWPQEVERAVEDTRDMSGAQVQAICTERAQKLFWQDGPVLTVVDRAERAIARLEEAEKALQSVA